MPSARTMSVIQSIASPLLRMKSQCRLSLTRFKDQRTISRTACSASNSIPSSFCTFEPTAAICMPRVVKVSRFSITATFAPASAAASAAESPATPAPTTTTSAVTVSLISLSGMGSGGVRNDGCADAAGACGSDVASDGTTCGLHPANAPAPAAANPTPRKKLRRERLALVLFLSLILTVSSSLERVFKW